MIFNFLIIFHYSLYILEAQVRDYITKFKQEKPELDDFEEEKKTLILKEKYFEKFNIIRK